MGFLDGFLGALGSIASEILQAIVYLFQLLVQVAVFIWNAVVIVANYVVDVFKAIGKFFSHVWEMFFKGVFLKLFHALQSLSQWLEAHLRPVIQFLRRVQAYIDRIYKLYVRPFLLMIQHIRQFLAILRALHIKFAEQLDRVLGTIQRDVNGVFLQIRGTLNLMIDLLNILSDPTMLLRKPTIILSLRRIIPALIRQLTGLPPGMFFASRSVNAPVGLGKIPKNFNPHDPAMNPPASYYLGQDYGVPSFDFLGPGGIIGDTAIDDIGALDGLADQADDQLDCVDAASCLAEAARIAARGE